MATVDLKARYRSHYTATRTPELVDVPTRVFLMIDGRGDPNTATEYREAVQTLYPLAYGIRAAVKEATGDAYTVMPLEALWWVPDMTEFDVADKASWWWTVMICLPEAATPAITDDVVPRVSAAKALAAGDRVRVEAFTEGSAAQVLHLGPYTDEGPTVTGLHRFLAEGGRALTGKHHEIYLSDPRRVAPASLRTIVRQPCSAR